MNTNPIDKRSFGLDLFRSIAILTVVFLHGTAILVKGGLNMDWLKMPDGVEIFFVLSGFLIGNILFRLYTNCTDFGFKEIKLFYKRRWYRTLPVYYLFLVINIILAFNFNYTNIEDLSFKFVFFLQNINNSFFNFFNESWSLSIEEWFYLLFPVLLFTVGKLSTKKQHAFLISVLIFILIPVCIRFFRSDLNVDGYLWDNGFRKTVTTRLDSIGVGVLSAYFFNVYANIWGRFKNIFFLIGIVLYVLEKYYLEFGLNSIFGKVFSFSYQSFMFALCLPFFSELGTRVKSIRKIFTFTSNISYSLYLINLPVAAFLLEKAPENNRTCALLLFLFYISIVYTLSFVTYKYYEKPIMNLRDK